MTRPTPPWRRPNVLALSATSLFTDISSEMIVPFLPMFLTVTLGASPLWLGAVEGAAETAASLLKLVSGRLADTLGRRRPLVLLGYGLSAVSRPLMAIAASPLQVLWVRLCDRTGKGIRSSPRDAILSASAPAHERGAVFGFHRAMDHLGAVLGPLAALGILWLWPADLRRLFALAALPGVLAVGAIVVGVREEVPAAPSAGRPSLSARPSRALLGYLVPLGVFTLGNSSDAFLLLEAGGTTDLVRLPLLWIAFNVVQAVSAGPLGAWSDRLGRRTTIGAGWALYAAVYGGFALVDSPWGMVALFLVYGLFRSFTEGAEKALVAELSDEADRGAAYGWYHLTSGVLALPASVLFGMLWEWRGPHVAFGTGAVLALLALLLLVALRPRGAP